jgi:hypothetical protein
VLVRLRDAFGKIAIEICIREGFPYRTIMYESAGRETSAACYGTGMNSTHIGTRLGGVCSHIIRQECS